MEGNKQTVRKRMSWVAKNSKLHKPCVNKQEQKLYLVELQT